MSGGEDEDGTGGWTLSPAGRPRQVLAVDADHIAGGDNRRSFLLQVTGDPTRHGFEWRDRTDGSVARRVVAAQDILPLIAEVLEDRPEMVDQVVATLGRITDAMTALRFAAGLRLRV